MNTLPQETILLVDDSLDMIDVLSEILRPSYRVKVALSGPEALALVHRDPPSLILLDVLMPDMDGHEICRRLKADRHTQDIPVIFLTGSSDARSEQRGLEMGAVDYLHKPPNPPLVLQRVRLHLELRNQNLALEARVQERTGQLEAEITERRRVEAEQRRLNRTLRLLDASNTVLLHAEQEEKLLADICQLLVEKGGYRMAWVGFPQEDAGNTLRPVARCGHCMGSQDRIRGFWTDMTLGCDLTDSAIRTGEAQVNQDIVANPGRGPSCEMAIECGYRSCISLPLVNNHAVLGVLTLYAAERQAFGAEEVNLLKSLANNLAFGIDGLRARNHLEATLQELQGFTYAASHDLRAPLARISNFSTLLDRNYRDRLDGDGLLFLDFIKQNALRMTALIDDLLAHAEIQHQFQHLQAVGLAPAVQAAVDERAEEIQARGVQVSINLPEVQVQASLHGLMQVLRNLLDNALKFSAQERPPVIEVGGRIVDGYYRFWLHDNGIGFDMAYHDKIFEIFRRLHTYAEYPGNGVGLALVKKAMEGMGGKVWAESRADQGATFFLELRV